MSERAETALDLSPVRRIVETCGRERSAALPILQAIQSQYRYLPREALELVCELTEIIPSQLSGVSTFYPQFRHHGAGQHLIQVCHGTACHVAGAQRISEAFRRELRLKDGQDTSSDGRFTVERVACLGCCTLAPVAKIDERVYGRLSAAKVPGALKDFLHQSRDAAKSAARRPARMERRETESGVEIRIGLNSCCIASGSMDVRDALEDAVRTMGANACVKPVGCTGMCHRVPLVEVARPNGRSTFYADNTAKSALAIAHRDLKPRGLWRKTARALDSAFSYFFEEDAGAALDRKIVSSDDRGSGEFLRRQKRIVTEGAGELNPLDIDDYAKWGGYEALRACVTQWTPERTIETIRTAGLQGRGGAGYLTAAKWTATRNAPGQRKYVICNGDEGDPGAFMDRMLLEAYPHRVVEGLAIAAYAVGASEGIFYIRAEYALAVQRIEQAIQQARAKGLLGERVCDSDFRLDLRIMRGAGAFVCGEESALIASVEGQRGMPRFRPPYPAEKGLWGCPTNVNNVETLACAPWIVRNGAEAFAAIGTAHSKGTKVFALAGQVARGGLIEVPMGATIGEIVGEIGGGVRNGRHFKAVQLGGPSGGCIPANLAQTPIDFEAVTKTGAIMGSGGLVVMDDSTCMVDVARFFVDFTQKESCGRCTFCRIGTKRMLEILERLCAGRGAARDLSELEMLSEQIRSSSLCGLGKTAPNPVLTTLRYFRDEYEAHVEGRCPAGKCSALIRYEIGDKCIGCTLCAQDCPTGAIQPDPYVKHVVNDDLCVRCGACAAICPRDAVTVEPRRSEKREEAKEA